MNLQTTIWAGFCLIALVAAIRWPSLSRRVLGGFFLLMALGVNVVYVLLDPAGFVHIGTDAPLLAVYAWGFEKVVAISPVAFGLLLAGYEITVGVLMLIGGRFGRLGLAGGILFLVLSTPLNTWTLPNLVLAAALTTILVREPAPRSTSAAGPVLVRLQRSA